MIATVYEHIITADDSVCEFSDRLTATLCEMDSFHRVLDSLALAQYMLCSFAMTFSAYHTCALAPAASGSRWQVQQQQCVVIKARTVMW
eukprot:5550-Heterococcus_DN1.PRE.6